MLEQTSLNSIAKRAVSGQAPPTGELKQQTERYKTNTQLVVSEKKGESNEKKAIENNPIRITTREVDSNPADTRHAIGKPCPKDPSTQRRDKKTWDMLEKEIELSMPYLYTSFRRNKIRTILKWPALEKLRRRLLKRLDGRMKQKIQKDAEHGRATLEEGQLIEARELSRWLLNYTHKELMKKWQGRENSQLRRILE